VEVGVEEVMIQRRGNGDGQSEGADPQVYWTEFKKVLYIAHVSKGSLAELSLKRKFGK